MTWADWYLVTLVVAWVGVSGYWAGAAGVYAELWWRELTQWERDQVSRTRYVWGCSLRWFLCWPVFQLLGAYRRDMEQRRR
jgi:hypothetical protein